MHIIIKTVEWGTDHDATALEDALSAIARKKYLLPANTHTYTDEDGCAPVKTMSKWISVDEDMPPTGQLVLISYLNSLDRRRTVIGHYIRPLEVKDELCLADEGTTEYCEDKDAFFYIGGWYEKQDNWDDYAFIYFNIANVPTHWMELPPPPGEKKT